MSLPSLQYGLFTSYFPPSQGQQPGEHESLLLLLFFFFNKFIYLFLAALGLRCCAGFLQLRPAGATLRCGARASHHSAFSCCGARALGMWASIVVACELSSCGSWDLERRLGSCGTWAQLLRGTWDLPGPGLEPVSPALAGGFLTTAPPGKSMNLFCMNFHVPTATEIMGIKEDTGSAPPLYLLNSSAHFAMKVCCSGSGHFILAFSLDPTSTHSGSGCASSFLRKSQLLLWNSFFDSRHCCLFTTWRLGGTKRNTPVATAM